jgi:3-deoxy-manno-octulosonate cytidylyltransferase (CMP-KDO synthetase)
MHRPMNPIVLIPARMAATRLPDKPLADIGGLPMIVRVLRQAELAGVGPVAVAAGDAEIVDAVRAAGGVAVLTDPALPSGSDRIQAALEALDPDGAHDAVINLQGDMPFVPAAIIAACAGLLAREPGCDVATVVAPESSPSDRSNPDVEALARFIAAPPSPLERREKLEQLRGLEMGLSYWAAVADEAPISVDNPADLEAARAYAKDFNA